jgi:acyl-CoA reductase-like NAD-dependent aldehyde dehydrogenase
MDLQRIIARTDAGDSIDATRSPQGQWSAKIDHADGDVHEDVPVALSTDVQAAIAAALETAVASCP